MARRGFKKEIRRIAFTGLLGMVLLSGCMSVSEPASTPLDNRVKLLEATITRLELQSTAAVSNLEKRVQQLEEDYKTLAALVKSRPSMPSV